MGEAQRQASGELLSGHARWLAKGNAEQLYRHPIHRWRMEIILQHTRDVRGRVLDLGCFTGHLGRMILDQGDKEVVGVDRLPEALDIARTKGLDTVLADVEGPLAFEDESFDCVVMAEMIDQCFDPDAVIAQALRVLKPGGLMIVSTPNLASWANRTLMLFGGAPHNLEIRAGRGTGRIRMFTARTLRNMLIEHGLDVRRITSQSLTLPSYQLPVIRRMPILKRWFDGPEYTQPRWVFNRTLGRMLPGLGESLIGVFHKRGSVA